MAQEQFQAATDETSGENAYMTAQEQAATEAPTDDVLSTGYMMLSFFIPLAGIIIYFSKKSSYPNKAKTAIRAASLGIVITAVFRLMAS